MAEDDRPFEPGRFVVQFFFGAVFGAFAGFCLGVMIAPEPVQIWLWVLGMAIALGLLAGFLGDRFWDSFREWWNPFRWFEKSLQLLRANIDLLFRMSSSTATISASVI